MAGAAGAGARGIVAADNLAGPAAAQPLVRLAAIQLALSHVQPLRSRHATGLGPRRCQLGSGRCAVDCYGWSRVRQGRCWRAGLDESQQGNQGNRYAHVHDSTLQVDRG